VPRENEHRNPELEELLLAERARTAALEKQLKAQSSFLATVLDQRETVEKKECTLEENTEPMTRLMRLQGQMLEAVNVISARVMTRAKTQEAVVETLCSVRVRTARESLEKQIEELKVRLAERDKELEDLSKLATELKTSWTCCASQFHQSQQQVADLKLKITTLELAKSLLHKQILELKRTNQQLQTDSSLSRAVSPLPLPPRKSSTPVRTERNNESMGGAVSHLRHLLELERKNLRAAKSALADELRLRTDLEAGLKDALYSIKAEIDIGKSRNSAGELIAVLEGQKKLLEVLRERAAGMSSSYFGLKVGLPVLDLDVQY
jgi:predicted nucleic acid-binding protein